MRDYHKRRIAAVLIFLLLGTCLSACGKQTEQIPELLEPVGSSQLAVQVTYQDIYDERIVDGQIVPSLEKIMLGTEGLVLDQKVFMGDEVKAGDILLQLDTEKMQEEVDTIASKVAYLEADNEYTASVKYYSILIARKELEKLQAQGGSAVSILKKEQEIDRLEMEYDQLLETQQYDMADLKKELEKVQEKASADAVTAPVDGVVVYAKNLSEGDRIGEEDLLFIIADPSRAMLRTAYLTESAFTGSRVKAVVNGKEYDVEYSPVDVGTYTSLVLKGKQVRSYYDIIDPGKDLKSGMYAALCLFTHEVQHVLTIPQTALSKDDESYYVYVLEDGVRHRRDITVGEMTSLAVEVRSGLEEGEWVSVRE